MLPGTRSLISTPCGGCQAIFFALVKFFRGGRAGSHTSRRLACHGRDLERGVPDAALRASEGDRWPWLTRAIAPLAARFASVAAAPNRLRQLRPPSSQHGRATANHARRALPWPLRAARSRSTKSSTRPPRVALALAADGAPISDPMTRGGGGALRGWSVVGFMSKRKRLAAPCASSYAGAHGRRKSERGTGGAVGAAAWIPHARGADGVVTLNVARAGRARGLPRPARRHAVPKSTLLRYQE